MSNESVFHAISHPTHRRILELLLAKERVAGDLLEAAKISKPSLSRHLAALRPTGLVTYRRHGTSLQYQINRSSLNAVVAWIDRFRSR